MDRKILGYILGAVGLAGVALSYPVVRTALKITIPANIADKYIMIAAGVVFIVGAFFAFGGAGGSQPSEVPIYHGKEVVGFRRLEK